MRNSIASDGTLDCTHFFFGFAASALLRTTASCTIGWISRVVATLRPHKNFVWTVRPKRSQEKFVFIDHRMSPTENLGFVV